MAAPRRKHERGWKHSTLVGLPLGRACDLVPAFGTMRHRAGHAPPASRLAATTDCHDRRRQPPGGEARRCHALGDPTCAPGGRTGCSANPARRRREATRSNTTAAATTSTRSRRSGRLSAPPTTEKDGAIYLTAAFAGLRRGEIRRVALARRRLPRPALRVELARSGGELVTPQGRAGAGSRWCARWPRRLARLGSVGLVHRPRRPGVPRYCRPPDGRLGAAPPLPPPWSAPGCVVLRFHDLRHTFGSARDQPRSTSCSECRCGGPRRHHTTMRYLHHKSRADEAALLAKAFAPKSPESAMPEIAPDAPTR